MRNFLYGRTCPENSDTTLTNAFFLTAPLLEPPATFPSVADFVIIASRIFFETRTAQAMSECQLDWSEWQHQWVHSAEDRDRDELPCIRGAVRCRSAVGFFHFQFSIAVPARFPVDFGSVSIRC